MVHVCFRHILHAAYVPPKGTLGWSVDSDFVTKFEQNLSRIPAESYDSMHRLHGIVLCVAHSGWIGRATACSFLKHLAPFNVCCW